MKDITKNEDIKNYIIVFSKKLFELNVNRSFFDINRKSLRVIKTRKLESYANAFYDVKTNVLNFNKNIDKHINHELLHMSSTFGDKTFAYSGFSVTNCKTNDCFGDGINEGMTELIDSKYFTKDDEVSLEHKLVDSLTDVLGTEFMMNNYFNADLYPIIKKLECLIGYNKAYNIVKLLDDIYYNSVDNNKKEVFKSTKLFLKEYAYLYLKMLFLSYYKHEITTEIVDVSIEQIESLVKSNLDIKGYNNNFLNNEEYKKIERLAEDSAAKVLKI